MVACDDEVSIGGEQTRLKTRLSYYTRDLTTLNFILNEFYESKVIEWILHVCKTFGPHQYDMIIGHDLMSQLGIILDFERQTITWDKSTIKMKEYEDLLDIN
jgi:hypothetical protein